MKRTVCIAAVNTHLSTVHDTVHIHSIIHVDYQLDS